MTLLSRLFTPKQKVIVPEKPKKPTGVRLRHTGGITNQLYVVENNKRPYEDGGFDCNLCIGVHHRGKATHLWLEPDGGCFVSIGVLEELKAAGMPNLAVVGYTYQPPPLAVGNRAKPIVEQNNDNRRINVLPHIPELTGAGNGTADA